MRMHTLLRNKRTVTPLVFVFLVATLGLNTSDVLSKYPKYTQVALEFFAKSLTETFRQPRATASRILTREKKHRQQVDGGVERSHWRTPLSRCLN